MNNINCEHCGALIDVEKDIKCPNCGAPYKNNKQYKEYQAYQKKQKEIDLESKQIDNDIKKSVHNTSKKAIPAVFIVVFIIFFISFITFILLFRMAFSSLDDYHEKRADYLNNKEYIDYLQKDPDNLYIFFNEYAYTDRYDIKIDKVVNYKEMLYSGGKELYGFHVVFNNKTPNWVTLNDITLTCKNSDDEEKTLSKEIVSTKTLDFFAKDNKTYEGYIYYDIDDDVKDVTFKFENIYITIFDFRNKIK